MSTVDWALVVAGAALALYSGLVAGLFLAGRRTGARAIAGFIPDLAVLFSGLLRDPRVPRRRKVWIGALVAYLASPIDLVPDFIPVVGQLDDAVLVMLVMRIVLRGTDAELVREHWRGPESSLKLVLRLAGRPASL